MQIEFNQNSNIDHQNQICIEISDNQNPQCIQNMAGIIQNPRQKVNFKKLYKFLKHYTFKSKDNEIDDNPLRVSELKRLNQIIKIIYQNYSTKDINLSNLNTIWSIIGFLFLRRPGLILNQFFNLLIHKKMNYAMYQRFQPKSQVQAIVNIIQEQEWYQNEQFRKSLQNIMQTKAQTINQQTFKFILDITQKLSQNQQFESIMESITYSMNQFGVFQQLKEKKVENKVYKFSQYISGQRVICQNNDIITQPDSFIFHQLRQLQQQQILSTCRKLSQTIELDDNYRIISQKELQQENQQTYDHYNNQSRQVRQVNTNNSQIRNTRNGKRKMVIDSQSQQIQTIRKLPKKVRRPKKNFLRQNLNKYYKKVQHVVQQNKKQQKKRQAQKKIKRKQYKNIQSAIIKSNKNRLNQKLKKKSTIKKNNRNTIQIDEKALPNELNQGYNFRPRQRRSNIQHNNLFPQQQFINLQSQSHMNSSIIQNESSQFFNNQTVRVSQKEKRKSREKSNRKRKRNLRKHKPISNSSDQNQDNSQNEDEYYQQQNIHEQTIQMRNINTNNINNNYYKLKKLNQQIQNENTSHNIQSNYNTPYKQQKQIKKIKQRNFFIENLNFINVFNIKTTTSIQINNPVAIQHYQNVEDLKIRDINIFNFSGVNVQNNNILINNNNQQNEQNEQKRIELQVLLESKKFEAFQNKHFSFDIIEYFQYLLSFETKKQAEKQIKSTINEYTSKIIKLQNVSSNNIYHPNDKFKLIQIGRKILSIYILAMNEDHSKLFKDFFQSYIKPLFNNYIHMAISKTVISLINAYSKSQGDQNQEQINKASLPLLTILYDLRTISRLAEDKIFQFNEYSVLKQRKFKSQFAHQIYSKFYETFSTQSQMILTQMLHKINSKTKTLENKYIDMKKLHESKSYLHLYSYSSEKLKHQINLKLKPIQNFFIFFTGILSIQKITRLKINNILNAIHKKSIKTNNYEQGYLIKLLYLFLDSYEIKNQQIPETNKILSNISKIFKMIFEKINLHQNSQQKLKFQMKIIIKIIKKTEQLNKNLQISKFSEIQQYIQVINSIFRNSLKKYLQKIGSVKNYTKYVSNIIKQTDFKQIEDINKNKNLKTKIQLFNDFIIITEMLKILVQKKEFRENETIIKSVFKPYLQKILIEIKNFGNIDQKFYQKIIDLLIQIYQAILFDKNNIYKNNNQLVNDNPSFKENYNANLDIFWNMIYDLYNIIQNKYFFYLKQKNVQNNKLLKEIKGEKYEKIMVYFLQKLFKQNNQNNIIVNEEKCLGYSLHHFLKITSFLSKKYFLINLSPKFNHFIKQYWLKKITKLSELLYVDELKSIQEKNEQDAFEKIMLLKCKRIQINLKLFEKIVSLVIQNDFILESQQNKQIQGIINFFQLFILIPTQNQKKYKHISKIFQQNYKHQNYFKNKTHNDKILSYFSNDSHFLFGFNQALQIFIEKNQNNFKQIIRIFQRNNIKFDQFNVLVSSIILKSIVTPQFNQEMNNRNEKIQKYMNFYKKFYNLQHQKQNKIYFTQFVFRICEQFSKIKNKPKDPIKTSQKIFQQMLKLSIQQTDLFQSILDWLFEYTKLLQKNYEQALIKLQNIEIKQKTHLNRNFVSIIIIQLFKLSVDCPELIIRTIKKFVDYFNQNLHHLSAIYLQDNYESDRKKCLANSLKSISDLLQSIRQRKDNVFNIKDKIHIQVQKLITKMIVAFQKTKNNQNSNYYSRLTQFSSRFKLFQQITDTIEYIISSKQVNCFNLIVVYENFLSSTIQLIFSKTNEQPQIYQQLFEQRQYLKKNKNSILKTFYLLMNKKQFLFRYMFQNHLLMYFDNFLDFYQKSNNSQKCFQQHIQTYIIGTYSNYTTIKQLLQKIITRYLKQLKNNNYTKKKKPFIINIIKKTIKTFRQQQKNTLTNNLIEKQLNQLLFQIDPEIRQRRLQIQ